MSRPIRCLLLLLLLFTWAFAEVKPHRPIRCQRDNYAQLVSMDTSITRFRHPTQGYTVDLISVVHVGSPAYYARLNKLFRKYDAVLYELIADSSEGRPIPARSGPVPDNPLGAMQSGLSSVLGLEFQLKHIDYSPKNFVHADFSGEELQASMANNNESFLQIVMRSLQGGNIDNPEADQELTQVNLMRVATNSASPEDRVHLRRALALLFSKPEQTIELLEGPGGGSLLAGRNQKALSVLRQQVAAGKKNIAIFYGAAHMLDMEKRLLRDFGVKYQNQSWIPAWDLRNPTQ